MALVLDRGYLHLELAATDINGRTITRQKVIEFELHGADDATKKANLAVDADAFVTDFLLLTDAVIIQKWEYAKAIEDSASLNQTDLFKECGIVYATNDAGTKKATFYLPAPKTAVMDSNGTSIDKNDTDVQNFSDNFKAANYARISDGESIRAADPILTSKSRNVKSGKSVY